MGNKRVILWLERGETRPVPHGTYGESCRLKFETEMGLLCFPQDYIHSVDFFTIFVRLPSRETLTGDQQVQACDG